MKVYLDDIRPAPDDWVRVYWPDEAIQLLKTGKVDEISLDHDLGDDNRGTGYDVLLWLEEAVMTQGFNAPIINLHTANTPARQRMQQVVATIYAFQNKKQQQR